MCRTPFHRTWDELQCVHLLVIELEHPILGFERSNIELRTLFDPSLIAYLANWNSIGVRNMNITIIDFHNKYSFTYIYMFIDVTWFSSIEKYFVILIGLQKSSKCEVLCRLLNCKWSRVKAFYVQTNMLPIFA